MNLVEEFWKRVRKSDGCWEWTGTLQKRPNGAESYGLFTVGRKRRVLAHKFSYELAHGPVPPSKVVRHRCDNPKCVRPDHLLVGTQADNLADMRARGRAHFNKFQRGQQHPNAKVDASKVQRIRARRREGLSLAAIGAEFGLHASTVHDIVQGRTWTHVA